MFLPPSGHGGNKEHVSNIIMSTSFALKFQSNKIIDVDNYISSIDCQLKVAHYILW